MSEAQWPVLPMPADAAVEEPSDSPHLYTLVVEENAGSGDSMRWSAGRFSDQSWLNLGEARRQAERLAWRYAPRHPMSEQRRAVYRLSPNQYLTIVDGATSTFSFRVTIAEPMGMQEV